MFQSQWNRVSAVFLSQISSFHCWLIFFLSVYFSDSLRALYLGDNDFETLPPEIGKLKNLQIVSYHETCVTFNLLGGSWSAFVTSEDQDKSCIYSQISPEFLAILSMDFQPALPSATKGSAQIETLTSLF